MTGTADRFGEDEAELARRRRIPLFLLLAATVTASSGRWAPGDTGPSLGGQESS